MSKITDPARARRMARVLVSDLATYDSDQVRIGLEKDDLFERFSAEIQRAHVYYTQHVDASVADRERIFDHALVDVLVYGNRRVSTHIW